jgi:hypothetical protein
MGSMNSLAKTPSDPQTARQPRIAAPACSHLLLPPTEVCRRAAGWSCLWWQSAAWPGLCAGCSFWRCRCCCCCGGCGCRSACFCCLCCCAGRWHRPGAAGAQGGGLTGAGARSARSPAGSHCTSQPPAGALESAAVPASIPAVPSPLPATPPPPPLHSEPPLASGGASVAVRSATGKGRPAAATSTSDAHCGGGTRRRMLRTSHAVSRCAASTPPGPAGRAAGSSAGAPSGPAASAVCLRRAVAASCSPSLAAASTRRRASRNSRRCLAAAASGPRTARPKRARSSGATSSRRQALDATAVARWAGAKGAPRGRWRAAAS